MSDEEYEYGSDGDDGYNYGSDQGGEDAPEDDARVAIENAYYEGDDFRQDQPKKALELFEKVVQLETELGDEVKWRFKALGQMVALHFRLRNHEAMLRRYREMLAFVGSVTRNECTDAVNGILDTLATSTDLPIVGQMYEMTLGALKDSSNERMWFNTNVKLARVYMQIGDAAAADKVINELHRSCQIPVPGPAGSGGGPEGLGGSSGSGSDWQDDPQKSSYLLEVYGLVIQLCSVTKNSALMKQVYPKIMRLNAAVEDPRIMGVIREQGGKMYMGMENWDAAYNEFYEGFRNYQEAGNAAAKECLKYVVLANMLALSDINPFAAREAKVYMEEKEIMAMRELRLAYEGNDLERFERTLRNRTNKILDDPFVMKYIDPLRRRMHEQVLLALVRPYEKITLAFVARELKLPAEEVESLLISMILDERIRGRIDQVEGYLLLGDGRASLSNKRYDAIARWADALGGLTTALADRVSV